jgi:O-antigen/teichoic acid export membrane protein
MTSPPTTTAAGGAAAAAVPRHSVLARIVTYAPGSIVPAMLTLATSVVFTRIFSASDFGTYGLFLAVAVPLKLLATTWLTQSIGKFLPQETTRDGAARVTDAVAVSTALVLAVESVLGLAAVAVGRALLPADQQHFLGAMVAFVVVSSAFEVLGILFATQHRAREYVAYKLTDSVATFGLRLLLVSAAVSMDITLMFWSVVISNGVLVPLMWHRAGLGSPARLLRLARTAALRPQVLAFATFGLPMTVWFFSSILLDVGDRYVINHVLGPAAVGIYDANYRLITGTAALLVVPVTITMHPYLMSISGAGDEARINEVIGTVVQNLLVVGTLAVGLTAVFHHDIAGILLGPEFREGSVIMPVVLAGVILFNVGTFVHKPFEIVGRTRPMVAFGVLAAVVNVLLNLALVPRVGYLGAAYATLASYLLYTVGVGVLGRRIHAWRIDRRATLSWTAFVVGGLLVLLVVRRLVGGMPYAVDLAVGLLLAAVLTGWCLVGLVRRTSVAGVLGEVLRGRAR